MKPSITFGFLPVNLQTLFVQEGFQPEVFSVQAS